LTSFKELLESTRNAGIELDSGRIRKLHPYASVDLNGIAKGDAVDRVSDVLKQNGIVNYLVEVGGEVLARGAGPFDDGWVVGIEAPSGGLLATLRLNSGAVATSGDYINYYELAGRRYSHLLDPASGKPVDHRLSMVCVAAPSAMDADAWSTALMVMGLERGYAFALQNRMAALFVSRQAGGLTRIDLTPPFNSLIQQRAAPT
jgi:thiamine biosynthesis lipoprotein